MPATTVSAAHETLRQELISALMSDPTLVVATPAFIDELSTRKPMTAAEVIKDAFDATGNERALADLLRIVAVVAHGDPDKNAGVAARTWIARQAELHAVTHRDDAARDAAETEDGSGDDWRARDRRELLAAVA